MRHTSRISRLERLTSVSAERRQAADSESRCNRFSELIMSDPVAHGLIVRIVALTPDGFGNPSFDFVKAAQERPGLAEAAAELGRRVAAN